MLEDRFSRRFRYLRLSLTEKCNFRCRYCLPNGFNGHSRETLNLNEIINLATSFQEMGIKKIRLTGGEPALRSDLIEIIKVLKETVGIEQVALTTNGFRLEQDLKDLKSAGLDSLNVSLDSLDAQKFLNICGVDRCESIKRAVEQALSMDFQSVKINSVLMAGLNDDEFGRFLDYVKTRDLSVRFIELMRTHDNKDFFGRHHRSLDTLEADLTSLGWLRKNQSQVDGPAKEFFHKGSIGRIGFIAPYSKDFCTTCNRLRVSARGGLRLCLFGEGEVSLREHLQNPDDHERLQDKVLTALGLKSEAHRLHENQFGDMHGLSSIGG